MEYLVRAQNMIGSNPKATLNNYYTSDRSLPNKEFYHSIIDHIARSAESFEKLVPAGALLQIFKKGLHDEFNHAVKHPRSRLHGNSLVAIFVDPSYHQEIILSTNLFSDHGCDNLRSTLQMMFPEI